MHRQPRKILERPPHKVLPATWHLDPDINTMEGEGPLTRDQLRAFFEDGFLFIPEHFDMTAIKRVEDDVDQMIGKDRTFRILLKHHAEIKTRVCEQRPSS